MCPTIVQYRTIFCPGEKLGHSSSIAHNVHRSNSEQEAMAPTHGGKGIAEFCRVDIAPTLDEWRGARIYNVYTEVNVWVNAINV